MLEIRGAAVTYRRRGKPFLAVHDINLDVESRDRIGIVGRSGSGKTTIARLMLGLVQPSAGQVLFEGEEITGDNLHRLRAAASLVHQDPNASLNPRLRVGRIIDEPLGRRANPAELNEVMTSVGLAPSLASRYPHQLSGGQRQRVAIARALIDDPRLLVADEPVSALDVLVRAQVLRVLRDEVLSRELALVMVSHDLTIVQQLCNRILVVNAGEIVEDGTVEAVFGDPRHDYTKQLLAATLTL